jgi:steroid 5-alpha reductase family enzyme
MPDSFLSGLAPSSLSGVLGSAALFLFIYFTLWFLVTEALRNGGLVDIGWGAGFVLLAAWRMLLAPSFAGVLLWLAVAAWGIRLAMHIGLRNIGKPEDARYAGFRREWGKGYPLRAYFQLFLFQGLMMGIISLPFLLGYEAARQGQPVSVVVFIGGLLVFGFGLAFEAQADRQLAAFLSKKRRARSLAASQMENPDFEEVGLPPESLLTTGLWAWSRHPNYFGESVAWWGIYFMGIALGAPWWTMIGPIVITLLLRFVSGVPLLEKRMRGRPGYDAYATATPIFIPRRPRKEYK